VNEYNFEVNFTDGYIYSSIFACVVNDYNSTKFNFTFDKEGRKVFKLLYPDGTIYVDDIKDGSITLAKGILNQDGYYKFDISLYGTDSRLTTLCSNEFYVRKELVSTDETVIPDDRVPVLDGLINDVNAAITATNNLDVDATKEDKTTTVVITKKDGSTKSVVINDGEPGADGPQGPQGETGPAGPAGKDGAVQYTAGKNITIEDNTISATDPDLSDYYTKEDIDMTLSYMSNNISTNTANINKLDTKVADNTENIEINTTDIEAIQTNKQDTLTAGENIKIEDNVISAEGGTTYLGQLTSFTETNPLDITNLKEGVYTIMYNPANGSSTDTVSIYLKATYSGSEIVGNATLSVGSYISCSSPIYLEIMTPMSSASEDSVIGYICWTERSSVQEYDHYDTRKIKITSSAIDLSEVYSQSLDNLMTTDSSQVITGLKAFGTLPTSEVEPTSDNEFTTKKYVDDSISTAITSALGGEY